MNTSRTALNQLDNPRLRRTAERLIYRCGIRADLKGSDCLADAAILYSCGARLFYAIYDDVGAYRGKKSKTVQREISYCIAQAPDLAERLSAMIGCRVSPADIHSSLVIAYLGKLLESAEIVA